MGLCGHPCCNSNSSASPEGAASILRGAASAIRCTEHKKPNHRWPHFNSVWAFGNSVTWSLLGGWSETMQRCCLPEWAQACEKGQQVQGHWCAVYATDGFIPPGMTHSAAWHLNELRHLLSPPLISLGLSPVEHCPSTGRDEQVICESLWPRLVHMEAPLQGA